jgi:integrase
MASLNKDGEGFTVQVFCPDGKRRSICLGKVPRKAAEAFKVRVERLAVLAGLGESPDLELARWLASLPDKMASRLARAGLCHPRRVTTLGAFLEELLDRPDLAPGSVLVQRQWTDGMVRVWGDVPLASITPADVDRLAAELRSRYAPSTAARWLRGVRGFLEAARRRELIARNPAEHLRIGDPVNTGRRAFVTRETFSLVLGAAPDANWRALLCLSRFGAMRVPSETSLLKWEDVAWDNARFTVTSPKTARTGKGCRVTPLFPELAAALREAWELADEGAVYVLTGRPRGRSVNLRKALLKICRRAGVVPWPKPFTNMRASRVTELADEYPSHVVNAWCGHSEAVSQAHYRQVTESHFARAAGNGLPARVASPETDKTYPQ